jgi:plastocyanin
MIRAPRPGVPERDGPRRRPAGVGVRIALLACVAILASTNGSAATLSGTIVLREGDVPGADLTGAMVWFVPEGGVKPAPGPVAVEVATRDRRFSPRTVAVPVGSTVRFPNSDPIKHNVFSVSPGNRFDLGLYGEGAGRTQRFDRPGLVRVYCNVHRTMSAFVLVLETPYYAPPDPEGRFALAGLPEGPGTLHVWHPRAEAWSLAVRVPAGAPVMVTLDATSPTVPPHLNKHGQPYPEPARDERYR